MRVWVLLLAGCGVHEHGVFTSDGQAADPTLKGDGAIQMLQGEDAGVEDTGAPGCERIPPYDAGPRAFTQPCGPRRCDPDTQYCEIMSPGVMGASAYYQCQQAPKDCQSKVTCACLKTCLVQDDACDDSDGGVNVAVAGQ